MIGGLTAGGEAGRDVCICSTLRKLDLGGSGAIWTVGQDGGGSAVGGIPVNCATWMRMIRTAL